MQKSIIRKVTALAGCILIAAGCIQRSSIVSDGRPISFSAGTALLRDDATKGAPKEGPLFDTGDKISVYGWHAGSQTLEFDDQPVEYASGSWSYSPVHSWEWQAGEDYYDFLAIYRYQTAPPHPSAATSPRLIVSQPYYIADDYDLMMAGVRRRHDEADRNRVVPLVFQHMCSAVRIVVYNDSQTTDFTLDAYKFKNIPAQSTARVQINAGDVVYGWTGAQRTAGTEVGGAEGIGQTLVHGSAAPGYTGDYQMLIPAALDEELGTGTGNWPKLVLRYTKQGGVQEETEVNLKDICRLGANEEETQIPLLQWERGVKYIYRIHLKLDGGIVVHVQTTDWEVVEAETPGLLI
jgi:hypothetical protein